MPTNSAVYDTDMQGGVTYEVIRRADGAGKARSNTGARNIRRRSAALGNRISVVSINPITYHRRAVRLLDEETGKQRELVYGDSVSEQVIRRRAPMLWRQATPIKNEEKVK